MRRKVKGLYACCFLKLLLKTVFESKENFGRIREKGFVWLFGSCFLKLFSDQKNKENTFGSQFYFIFLKNTKNTKNTKFK